jgi:hypothetical protein
MLALAVGHNHIFLYFFNKMTYMRIVLLLFSIKAIDSFIKPEISHRMVGNRIKESNHMRIRRFLPYATLEEDIIESMSPSESESFKAPEFEVERRRNFAIISHPDAGIHRHFGDC